MFINILLKTNVLFISVYKPFHRNWSSPEYDKLNSLSSSEMEQLIFNITPQPDQSIIQAMFNGQRIINISEEFRQVYTDFGKLTLSAIICIYAASTCVYIACICVYAASLCIYAASICMYAASICIYAASICMQPVYVYMQLVYVCS